MITDGSLNAAEIRKLTEADEWYAAERDKLDGEFVTRYSRVLDVALKRLEAEEAAEESGGST